MSLRLGFSTLAQLCNSTQTHNAGRTIKMEPSWLTPQVCNTTLKTNSKSYPEKDVE